jgi:hypothetical protein
MLLYGSLFVASVHLLCPSICRLAVVVPMTQAPPTYIDIPDTPPYINIPDTPEQQS